MKTKTKKITKPNWFQLKNYNKKLSPEEWLNEIYKRVMLNNDSRMHIATTKVRELIFKEYILKNKNIDYVNSLLNTVTVERGRPINQISMFDLAIFFFSSMNSEWLETNKDWLSLQQVIVKLLSKQKLNIEEQKLEKKFRGVPLDVIIADANKNYPIVEHLNGTPVTINISFDRDIIIDELRKFLTASHSPKQKKRLLTEKTFETWARAQILAIFDLMVWFNISDTKLKNMQLLEIIWGGNVPYSKREQNKSKRVTPKNFIVEAIALSNKVINLKNIKVLVGYCKNRQNIKKNRQISLQSS